MKTTIYLLLFLLGVHQSTARNITMGWRSPSDRLLQRVHLTGSGNGLAPLDTKVLAGDPASNITQVRIFEMGKVCEGVVMEHAKGPDRTKLQGVHVRAPKDCTLDYMVEIYGQ